LTARHDGRSIQIILDIDRNMKAGASLTAVALHLEPAEAAIETLPNRERGLRGPAKTFHPQ
jgi:hypothetical protein